MDRKLVIFLAKASLPLNIIELQSFKELVQTLNPSYAAPTRKTLKKLMQKEVRSIDEGNKKLFSGDVKLAITVDEWSSKNASCALLAITGHVLKRDFSERANVVLDCVPLDEERSSHERCDKIKDSGKFCNLGIAANNVSFMVADGATVMIKAASDLGIQYIHCCAHVINLAVSQALTLPVCANALMKKTFKRLLKEEKLPQVIPMTDAPTRWSSTYFMICDFLAAMSAIERVASLFDMAPPEDGEIRTLKTMRTFLQPYQAATNQVFMDSS
ncbi:unnamed protein product [Cylicocyclus nassatus]|uniref:Uncharacterized protein n=1 Tax=Cylicocyclus nassatus TaxID=53992 RepID=A0AA36DL36_CYLNA|nr:unnamed protein product [Cylicocyclus nassatus]